MVDMLKTVGYERPNIALLSMVEKVAFHMKDTIEAQELVREHCRHPIADCQLVGPIAYDLILSKEAARLKGYDCPLCGEFDGIVVPSLLAGQPDCQVLADARPRPDLRRGHRGQNPCGPHLQK